MPGPRIEELAWLNPEYDLLSRTFLVLALADRALANPEEADAQLALMDVIIDDTLDTEASHPHGHWLLSYWDPKEVRGTGRSLFVDGELLTLINARRLVRDDRPELRSAAKRQSARVRANFGSGSPLPLAESYGNEGWLFCHAMALVGLRAEEVLDGADHSVIFSRFTATARRHLLDPRGSGMLVSSFTIDGEPLDGPEGSSLWFVTIALRTVDPSLADEQHRLARRALGRARLGFGYAREWPRGTPPSEDVDSGPIVPVIHASASASGFAIAASRAHHNRRWHRQLRRAVHVADLLMKWSPELEQWASNPVADAVIWWGLGFGPLWERLEAP